MSEQKTYRKPELRPLGELKTLTLASPAADPANPNA